MFTPVIGHGAVGQKFGWIAEGRSPYQPIPKDDATILCSGDVVTVQGVYDRDYLTHAPLLAYVYSHNTGMQTHVALSELHVI